MCVTNKHTSIPGTGLPVTAFTTVPEIRGVPIWNGEILSKKVTKFPGASFQKRTRTATTKRKRTATIKGKYGNHNLNFDRRSEDSNAADGRPMTTTTLSSSADPAQVSQTVTYAASVQSPSGEPITGSVTFEDDYIPSATVSLVANQATYSTSYPKTGVRAITVVYSGDANNAVSSSEPLVESVAKELTNTTTALISSGNPSLIARQ